MNGLELVQTHGIGWFCDRYKPRDKTEALVLEYLKENEGVEKHFTHFLARLSHEIPDDGIFTQPEGESAENSPQNTKENNQPKTKDMYRPSPLRYTADAIEAIQWLIKALDGLKDIPEAYNKLKPYLYGSKERLDLPLELGELKEKLLELRTKYLDEDERARKSKRQLEREDTAPFSLHVDEGSDRGGAVSNMPSFQF